MNNLVLPQDQVFWQLSQIHPKQLREDIRADVVIIGGGMAGLSAAHSFADKGYSVVLLEKAYCGGGASGKSSGFITPDSEIPLRGFIKHFGPAKAKELWEFVISGVELIRTNIKQFGLPCEYQEQNTLVVANSSRTIGEIQRENEAREMLGYTSTFYDKQQLTSWLNSTGYFAGVRYPNSFGINAYRYCQAMKDVLQKKANVQLYEETPALAFDAQGVTTAHCRVHADAVIVCADRFIPDLGALTDSIYHAQTFLMMSAELTANTIRALFPQENLMVWDTDLVYTYYRLHGRRLLLGGGSLRTMYASQAIHDSSTLYTKLTGYFKEKFPQLKISFEYFWPGLIGLSKDFMPIAGRDERFKNIYYIAATAGLPWAAALGRYSAEVIIDNKNEYDSFFSPYRKFTIGHSLQSVLGIKLSFAIANSISKLFTWR